VKTTICAACNNSVSLNDSFRIRNSDYCLPCAEELIKVESLNKGDVTRNVDPTICVQCQTDAGNRELARISGLPVCDACTVKLIERPFPAWVRGFLGGLAAVTVVGFILNFTYIHSFINVKQSGLALRRGDSVAAYEYMKQASELIPEDTNLRASLLVSRGMMLLGQGKTQEALPFLREASSMFGEEPGLKRMFLYAEASAGFDEKNYLEFHRLAEKMFHSYPNDFLVVAQYASALACLYAITGIESYQTESLKYLEDAKKLLPEDYNDFQEFEERIHHRLRTRRILTMEEFAAEKKQEAN